MDETALVQLYAALTEGDGATIGAASEAIDKAYEDPRMLSVVVGLLRSPIDRVRMNAAVGTGLMLKKHWVTIYKEEVATVIKGTLLAIISAEGAPEVRRLLIAALRPICRFREVPWPELDQCAIAFVRTDDIHSLEIGFMLFSVILPYLDGNALFDILPLVGERFHVALQHPSRELVNAAVLLIGRLAKRFEPPIPGILAECIAEMYMLLAHPELPCEQLASAIDKTIRSPPVMSAKRQLETMVGILQGARSSEHIMRIMALVASLVDKNFDDIEECVGGIVAVLLRCMSMLWSDECADDLEDCRFTVNIMSDIIKFLGPELYETISGFVASVTSPGELFAAVLTYSVYVEKAPDFVAEHLDEFVNFFVRCARVEQHHSVKEAAIGAIQMMIEEINGGVIEYRGVLLTTVVSAVTCEHTAKIGLDALTAFLGTLPVSGEMSRAVIDLVARVAKQIGPEASIVSCLSALVFAVQEEILPIANDVTALFRTACAAGDDEDLQIAGIIGLGTLHAVNMEQLRPEVAASVAVISRCQESGNTAVIGAVMSAFRMLIEAGINGIEERLPEQFHVAFTVLKAEPSAVVRGLDEEEKECDLEYSDDAQAKGSALRMITAISRRWPDAVRPYLDQLASMSTAMMVLPGVQTAIIKFFVELVITYSLDANVGIGTISKMFSENDPAVVPTLFSAFARLVVGGYAINTDMMTGIIAMAMKGLEGRLDCQDEEETDLDLMRKLSRFFVALAEHRPVDFPAERYIRFITDLDPEEQGELLGLAVTPLPYLCRPGMNVLGDTAKAGTITLLGNALQLCRGLMTPSPIRAVRTFAELSWETCGPLLPVIFANANEIFAIEASGRPTLRETRVAMISLLFLVLRHMGGTFDVSTYLPVMMKVIPEDASKDAFPIYNSLLFLVNQSPALLQPFGADLLVMIARTLTQRSQTLKGAKFPADLTTSLTSLLRQLMTQVPNAEAVVTSALDGEHCVSRLRALLS